MISAAKLLVAAFGSPFAAMRYGVLTLTGTGIAIAIVSVSNDPTQNPLIPGVISGVLTLILFLVFFLFPSTVILGGMITLMLFIGLIVALAVRLIHIIATDPI